MTNGDAFRAGKIGGKALKKSDQQLARMYKYVCQFCVPKETCDGTRCEERENHLAFMKQKYLTTAST